MQALVFGLGLSLTCRYVVTLVLYMQTKCLPLLYAPLLNFHQFEGIYRILIIPTKELL